MPLGVLIGLVVAALAALALYLYLPRGGAAGGSAAAEGPHDVAIPFGYKSQWLALKTDDADRALAALGLGPGRWAGWPEGIRTQSALFVTLPIDGWVLAVSPAMRGFAPGDSSWPQHVAAISERLGGEVQYFGSHRVVDYHAWCRADRGTIARAYAYVGDAGETLAVIGDPSEEELELGLDFRDTRTMTDADWEALSEEDHDVAFPDEDHVMQIAGAWSVDPTGLPEEPVGAGRLVPLPREWR